MKKLIVGVALLTLVVPMLLLAACGSEQKVPAGAIAAVGDGVVTQEQFDQIWKQAEAQYKSQAGAPPFPSPDSTQYNQLKASIVNYLVQNQIIKAKAADLGVTVTDKQFQERMTQIVKQVGGQKKLDKLLKEQSVTQAQLEGQLKAQMLQDAVQQKVYSSIKITPEQVKKYFEDPANKSQFDVPESVDARHILVKTKAEAEKVRALLEADNTDANWKKVAAQYSTDPGSKNNGGSLGNFPKGRMVKPFEDVGVRPQGRPDLAAGQDAVRLPHHRGHQEDRGQQADAGAGQVHHRAAAQVPEAGHGLGGLAQDGDEGRGRPLRRGLQPGQPHRLAEPGREPGYFRLARAIRQNATAA